jgi:5-(carboxyamino)imidazole ribonucleotide synthase
MNSNLIQKTLGIIGGGQLGKMLLSECNKMNIKTHVLDPNEDSPCKKITNKFYCGDFKDFDTVLNFGNECDLITFEIEHINVDALEKLEKLGKKVYPSSETLKIIQDKNKQKCFFKEHDIPSADFKYFNNLDDLHKSINNDDINFPCVWKKTKFGYDGFGVKILRSVDDIIDLPKTEMIIEDLVPFEKELSVIVSRNLSGEIKCYETVEMEFNSNSNQVEFVISPAKISGKLNEMAKKLAIKLSKSLKCVGLLAVEMFQCGDKILINEVAPRPHNSGHLTIEACKTSQFQQHIRSIFDLKLGNTVHDGHAIMLNLVGDNNYSGKVLYENLDAVFEIKNANLHIYGKQETRPNRKMGHITIICDNFEEGYNNAKLLKSKIKVKST